MRSGPPAPDDPYLSFDAPGGVPYKRAFPKHDAQTTVLIRQYAELSRFPHGETVVDRLDKWSWLDTMADPAEKQRFLEPLIDAIKKDPVEHEDKLVFLLIVCEPIRLGVTKEFLSIRDGLEPSPKRTGPTDWRVRQEATRLNEIDHQIVVDVIRAATLDALYRYPTPAPKRFFSWLRSAVAHAALNHLRDELSELPATWRNAAEAEAVQDALAGLAELAPPDLRTAPNRAKWRARIALRSVFDIAGGYYEHGQVRQICRGAVGRLPRRQQQVIDHLFFQDGAVDELANQRKISASTVYNHKAQALRNLHDDDTFFAALCSLGKVRDRARQRAVQQRYPTGRMPDGRRVVVISDAA